MTDIRGVANVEYGASILTAVARSSIEDTDSAAEAARLAITHTLRQIGFAMRLKQTLCLSLHYRGFAKRGVLQNYRAYELEQTANSSVREHHP